MKIKTKVTLGVVFLFAVILGIGGFGLYNLYSLSEDSENILKDNYESLEFTKNIVRSCDSLLTDSAHATIEIEKYIELQQLNVTEPGEKAATLALNDAFDVLRDKGINQDRISAIRKACLFIQDLNMQAIVKKNNITQSRADKASTYVIIILTAFTLIAFTFIVNFPSYIADPISKLTQSIKSIAAKNYEERLHFSRSDEFEELAEAFNLMAEKLDEYEHSNLAGILFEKKRIETIINRMPDPVIGLDERKKVVFANDKALQLLNLASNQLEGKYSPDIALANDLLRAMIKPHASSDKDSTLIKVAIDGKENYFSKENIPIRYNPTGEREEINIGEVILLKNVTPFKELDLAKTNFIATISHELKTPIASFQMCVKLLQDQRVGTLNEEQKNIIGTLQEETSRLSAIIGELLDLSQVETGNIKLDIKKTDPKDIVALAIAAVQLHAERKQVTIETDIPDNTQLVRADTAKTTWVLINLLTNAIRYSRENGKVILKCESKGKQVKFSVEDFGPGIDQRYLGKLFEKFFQVPGSAAGNGLGLAISKEFVEAQGGDVMVESEVGKGSTFSFVLNSDN